MVTSLSPRGRYKLSSDSKFADNPFRNHPDVVKQLEEWWEKGGKIYGEINLQGTVEGVLSKKTIDGDNRAEFRGGPTVLQQDEYELFYKHLVHAFDTEQGESSINLKGEDIITAMLSDWEDDSSGTPFLSNITS